MNKAYYRAGVFFCLMSLYEWVVFYKWSVMGEGDLVALNLSDLGIKLVHERGFDNKSF